MTNQLVKQFERQFIKRSDEKLCPGLVVKVYQKIKEGGKERIQAFQGLVIKIRGTGVSKTMTVRKIVEGVGVEKVFPIQSPLLDRIEILRESKVRRSKLYYMRQRSGKSARLKGKQKDELVEYVLVEDNSQIEAEKEASIESAKETILEKEAVEAKVDPEVEAVATDETPAA